MFGGLKRAIRDRLVKRELGKLEEKTPMIRRALAWLTHPDHPGRKRGIAAGAAILSGVLRGAHAGLQKACAEALLVADTFACKADPSAWAGWVEVAGAFTLTLQQGADLAAVVFGLLGIIHAQRRAPAALPPVLRPPGVVLHVDGRALDAAVKDRLTKVARQ